MNSEDNGDVDSKKDDSADSEKNEGPDSEDEGSGIMRTG